MARTHKRLWRPNLYALLFATILSVLAGQGGCVGGLEARGVVGKPDRETRSSGGVLLATFHDFDPRARRAMSLLDGARIRFGLSCGMGLCALWVARRDEDEARRALSTDGEIEPMLRGEDIAPPGWPPPPEPR